MGKDYCSVSKLGNFIWESSFSCHSVVHRHYAFTLALCTRNSRMILPCTSPNAVRNITTKYMTLAFLFLEDLVHFHFSKTTFSLDSANHRILGTVEDVTKSISECTCYSPGPWAKANANLYCITFST